MDVCTDNPLHQNISAVIIFIYALIDTYFYTQKYIQNSHIYHFYVDSLTYAFG
jgi:hypothetical protein